MKRYFNTTGPCFGEEHYMLPAQARLSGLRDLVDRGHYFIVHAARQSGKTTLLLDLVRVLNESGQCAALYTSLESVQGMKTPQEGVPAIVRTLAADAGSSSAIPDIPFAEGADTADFSNVLRTCLQRFCARLGRPLAIMFDEVDCLSNGTLVSFLRQLRHGYTTRADTPFVSAVALVGMRNIRDLSASVREDEETLGSASPFNIVKKSLTLRNFNREEVAALYAQHAADTGQQFPDEVVDEAYRQSQGQPWLANAIASEIVEEILEDDPSRGIIGDHVAEAVERIILRRDTHIDSLLERLKEDRVRRVVEPMLLGSEEAFDPLDDDVQLVTDLGLVKRENGAIKPANPIYAEVIARALSLGSQFQMQRENAPTGISRYSDADRLDVSSVLRDFQAFWRENSEIWRERYQYKEAAPHLILMAFLQNILNGEGRILREYATGRGRIDLCVVHQGQKYPIELKIWRGDKTIEDGRRQLSQYMDTMDCREGWLVIFDQREELGWDRRISWRDEENGDRTLHLVGC